MAILAQEKWIRNELDFPGDIGRGSTDRKAVKRVQEWVTFHGFGTGIDEDYGSATGKAVRAFQGSIGLPGTGVVDKATFIELTRPMRGVLAAITLAPADASEAIVAYARQHLAAHPIELGGANAGPWVRFYMKGSDGDDFLWCAGFACFVLRQAAEALELPESVQFTMSCDKLASAARQQERFLAGAEIIADASKAGHVRPGSLFLIRNPKNANDYIHTGIVIAADAEGITTIEGNTNQGGNRNGFEVCRRERSYKTADLYLLK
jgi:hypothetical protein